MAAVAREAEVSVVTLYEHFGSKDGLVASVLSRRPGTWDEVWQAEVDATDDPRRKVLALFDAVRVFRGQAGPTQWCSFLATASERRRAEDGPGDLVAQDTALLTRRLGALARAVDPDRSAEIVATVLLVYHGVLASLRGEPRDPVAAGRRTAANALGWQDA